MGTVQGYGSSFCTSLSSTFFIYLRASLAVFSSVLLTSPAIGGTFTAYGPQSYTRASGAPVTVESTFAVLNPSASYTLHAYNGGLQNDQVTGELVSSGKVVVNGSQLIGSQNFNQNVTTVEMPVALQTNNIIEVELKGKPGGVVTIQITGEDNDLPSISATLNPEPDATGWNHEAVTVNFQCNDATSGIQSCSDPVTLTAEGAGQIVTGTAVDRAGNSTSLDVTVNISFGPQDQDEDGVTDDQDNCPNTPVGETVNPYGCSSSQLDSDGDGINDAVDQCPGTPIGETTNGQGCSASQLDSDSDGVADNADLCPGTPAAASVDADGCATSQRDTDSDGVSDDLDQCPITPPGSLVDANGCAASERDTDNDGVNDSADQCPGTQPGATVDAQGCASTQLDTDGDGVSDALDLCPSTSPGASVDTDGCSVSQLDADNDGVPNTADQCPSTPPGESVNGAGCSASQLDSDQDGVTDNLDACPGTAFGDSVDLEGCSQAQGGSGPLLPDPATVAPALDPSKPTTVFEASAFLYTGSNPIQSGVAETTIAPQRASVLRGAVKDKDGLPLAGVGVTILGHPEFGQTTTRADGVFDMVVNGGGQLTINYHKRGYLTVQRKQRADWQNYSVVSDIVMLQLDSQATAITLDGGTGLQVARGSTMTDTDGTRTATIIFPANTSAELVMSDNSTQSISSLTVRATEFTVGDKGPQAMPGALPPSSAYTYAVELSVDEAIAAGATSVRFSQPVAFYVENFLNFPVGGIVPAGYYDRAAAHWVPSDNGRVISIVSVQAGLADVDVDGSGMPADAPTLAALGITEVERAQLAALYTPGQSLWRTPITHFTPWDCNWPFAPPENAEPPEITEDPNPASEDVDDPDCVKNSIIDCQNQTLGQSVDIIGTTFSLNYRSDRLPGRSSSYSLTIPVTKDTIPFGLKHVLVEIDIAGSRRFEQQIAAAPNQTVNFTWDGIDAYGRRLRGEQPAKVKIGYVYDAVYTQPQVASSFAVPSGITITGSLARQEVALWQIIDTRIGAWDARVQSLGGWTLDIHHAYVPQDKVLYLGNGTKRSADKLAPIVTTVAGNGERGAGGVGGPATSAQLHYPQEIEIAPDGSIYIVENGNHRVSRVSPAGLLTVVAGSGLAGFSGDGGMAVNAQLNSAVGIALGNEGTLYIADTGNNRIRKVTPDGRITTIAGGGSDETDGIPATAAFVNSPTDVAVTSDGTVYYIDDDNSTLRRRIRRVGLDGTVATLPLNSHPQLSHLVVGPDDAVYFSQISIGHKVYKINLKGSIVHLAGAGNTGFSGDGGSALNALLYNPNGMAISEDGSLYIADGSNWRIRRVAPDGIINTAVGNGISPPPFGDGQIFNGDGRIATQTSLSGVSDVAIGPDGAIYVADVHNQRVRRSAARFPGFSTDDILIASEDGSQVYQFDKTGRHEKTLNALTGAVLYEFIYDGDNRLIQVTDAYTNVTQILRYGDGQPYAVIAPHGQQTNLLVDFTGMLTSITNPAGESFDATYEDVGLMSSFKDQRGGLSNIVYHADGRLARDTNPAGGFFDLVKTDLTDGYEVARTSGEGRTVFHRIQKTTKDEQIRTQINADGSIQQTVINPNGLDQTTAEEGHITTLVEGPDPRFGTQSPYNEIISVSTPGGLLSQTNTTKTITFNDPDDPFSIDQLTDTVVVNGRTYTQSYNGNTRTITTTTPEGRQAFKTIDNNGRLMSQSLAGLHPKNFYYDALGRLTTAISGVSGDQRSTTFTYNSSGWLDAITDSLNRVTYLDHDPAGRVIRQTRPGGLITDLERDANGNITSWNIPGNKSHAFAFTPIDFESLYDPPDAGTGPDVISYAYNLDKQLTQSQRAEGDNITNGYDTAGRLQSVTTAQGVTSFGYESVTGRLASIAAPGGVNLAFGYDGPLLLSEVWSGPITGNVAHSYDNNFWVTTQSVNGSALNYAYDNDGLLVQAGALSLVRSPQNGLLISTGIGSETTSYAYNGFGELANAVSKHGANTLYQTSYLRDDLGRITQLTETIEGQAETRNYHYDAAGRLDEVRRNGTVIATYSYDDNGNRLERASASGIEAGSYDAQDRVMTYAGSTYQYTKDGELKSVSDGAQTTLYEYDALGNLRHVALPNGDAIDYLIDGRGRRVGKKVNGSLTRGWLYQDQLNPVAELDGNGNVVSRFVYGENPFVPAYMTKSGVTYRILSDHLGSPRLVINTSNGSIVQRLDYDEFGRVVVDSNPGFQPFGFAGGHYDQDTKLVRFGVRDYDAVSGRWTAKDPIRFGAGDTNLYAYVSNDPINFIDVYGTDRAGTAIGVAKLAEKSPSVYESAVELANGGDVNADQLMEDHRNLYVKDAAKVVEEASEEQYYDRFKRKADKLIEECRKLFK